VTQENTSFSVAEVAAFGAGGANTLLAQNEDSEAARGDNKSMGDGKTMIEAKDIPEEGPEETPPGEGPPPSLPPPPPFTFVPVMSPTSP
jgi:hypothetical protein